MSALLIGQTVNRINQIKLNVGFCEEGKIGVLGEKPLGAG